MVKNSTHTALIAGCGYLGSRVAAAWNQDGIVVNAITRSADRADDFRQRGWQPLLLDLSNPSEMLALPEADVVLWAVGFDRTAGVPREKTWLDGLRWLIRSLPRAPRRFIYISSTSVYGQTEAEAVDENVPVSPVTEGGQCCVQAEDLARAEFAERFPEIQVTVLRMAGIYGPDRLLRRIEDLRSKNALPGEPDHPLNLIHVDDAVRAVRYTADASDIPQLLNIVNSGTVTRRQYYTHLAELVAAPRPVFGASATGRQRGGNKRVVSCSSVNDEAQFSYDDVLAGLEDAVRRSTLSGQ